MVNMSSRPSHTGPSLLPNTITVVAAPLCNVVSVFGGFCRCNALWFMSPFSTSSCVLFLLLPRGSLTLFISSARDQYLWRPRLRQLESQQQHVFSGQRPVTGGAAPGVRVPPQGQRDAHQHPHVETWEHQVLSHVQRKRQGGDPQHSHALGRTVQYSTVPPPEQETATEATHSVGFATQSLFCPNFYIHIFLNSITSVTPLFCCHWLGRFTLY